MSLQGGQQRGEKEEEYVPRELVREHAHYTTEQSAKNERKENVSATNEQVHSIFDPDGQIPDEKTATEDEKRYMLVWGWRG